MKLGTNFKLYIDPSGVGISTWAEFTLLEDGNLNQERNVAEIANRASDWVKVLTGKRNASIELTATFKAGDVQYEAIRDAFIAGTDIGIGMMSGLIATIGSEGLQADCKVTQFNRQEPLQDAVKVTFTLRPSADSAVEPSYAEITV